MPISFNDRTVAVAEICPRPTRHRAVLSLVRPVRVYDMRREDDSISVFGLIKRSLRAESLAWTSAIATRDCKKREDGSGVIDIMLLLYKWENFEEDHPDPINCTVSVPIGWTPRILLSLLNKSIQSHGVISLESIKCKHGPNLLSINELNCYFEWNIDNINSMLFDNGAYAGVVGGTLID
jgi:hypothetical protein